MKVFYLITEDWYFWSHRLVLARAARDAGHPVVLMTHVTELGDAIRAEGFTLVPWSIDRGSMNPFKELKSFLAVLRAFRQHRPDVAHNVTLKSVLYGGLAARVFGVPSLNAIAGLGLIFSRGSLRWKVVRGLLNTLLRLVFGSGRAIALFQVESDRDILVEAGVVKLEDTAVIRGAGVDLAAFVVQPESNEVPVVVLAARLLWDKGIGDFVAAARLLRSRGVAARFALVGRFDPQNPGGVPEAEVEGWVKEGILEYGGLREDMPAVLASCNILCLPTFYGEGVPKILLEGGAAGRAIVATNIAGCREAVAHGESGLLVEPRDVPALADALQSLLADPEQRKRMGEAGRRRAEACFSDKAVVAQTMELYSRITRGKFATSSMRGPRG